MFSYNLIALVKKICEENAWTFRLFFSPSCFIIAYVVNLYGIFGKVLQKAI
eukprot:UN23960